MDPNNPLADPHLAYLMPIIFGFALVFIAIMLIPLWQICKKAGFSPWLSLLIFVPLGPILLLYVLAFATWKVVPVAQAVGPYPPAVYPPAGYPAAAPQYPPATPPPADPGSSYPRS